MAQWGQGYQYPMQTGFQPNNSNFQAQNGQQFGAPPGQFQTLQQPGQLQQQQQPLLSQQTGFARPAGFLQSQPTGFQPQPTGFAGPGLGSRPPPPVPPLPQGGLSFLNTQPPPPPPQRFGVPSGGLAPQMTGFAGRAGPLVPQMTGFVDPRLQMMSSVFMPANTSSPYSAAGAPLFSSQQLQGGLNLQQSFQQQQSPSQANAGGVKVPWALTKSEKKSYDNIFRAWDQKGEGFISGPMALEVFGQSGLPKDDLAKIW
jgi:actin cytoskeleton-regulatory complex protein PAN1